MVVGPCCTPADTFGTNVPLPEPKAGDLIGVFYSGAYGFSTGSLGFLSHPSPAEVLLRKGEPKLLRQAGKAEDALQGQRSLRA